MSYIKVEDLSLGYDSEIVCSNINFEINVNYITLYCILYLLYCNIIQRIFIDISKEKNLDS